MSAVTSAASTHDAPVVLFASPSAPGDLTVSPRPRSPAECWWENSSAMYSYSTDEDEYSEGVAMSPISAHVRATGGFQQRAPTGFYGVRKMGV